MHCKIGILWPGHVEDKGYKLEHDVQLIPNVRKDEVYKYSKQLIDEGARILVGTPSMASELHRCSSVPVAIAYASYIDILETLMEAERVHYPRFKRATLLLHAKNPIFLERAKPFTRFGLTDYYYEDHTTMEEIIEDLTRMDCRLLIGGMTSIALAARTTIEAFPLRYRSQSLESGIQKAREILDLIDAERRQSERLRTVLNIIPDGIVITEKNGGISMCNAQMAAFIGAEQSDFIGKPVTDVLQDNSWQEVYEKGASQTNLLVEFQRRQFFSTRRAILEDGQPSGAVGIMQEAHKIQAMERKYRRIQGQGYIAKYRFTDVVGDSGVMRDTVERAMQYARFDATVLIEGETGTGKELFAQSIHNASSRSYAPFVAINCAAIAENLLESELLGHEEGAFTGAKRGGKIGLFEQAHNGTLFLDEINQMPLSLQPKILRVIQERVVTRIGGTSAIPVNVRVIAASNENLARMVQAKRFRSDLFYRLNVLTLTLPPLRDRPDDIPLLIRHFIDRYQNHPLSVPLSSRQLTGIALGYSWPGNVRELQNYLERCSILGAEGIDRSFSPGCQQLDCPPPQLTPAAGDGNLVQVQVSSLEQMESEIVHAVVQRCGGNKSRAALLLDINRNTLSKKLKGRL